MRRLDDAGLGPVLAAAREAFVRYGVHRTRMEDIAKGAGMPRQYLYRFVSGRDELVELALLERCREFSDDLVARTESLSGDLDADLVTTLLSCVLIARADAEFGR